MRIWAPGRINLIGEHTDHTGGLVLPAAIELGLTIEANSTKDEIRLSSTIFGQAEPFACDGSGARTSGWGRLAQAVASELSLLGRPTVGLEAEVSSTLPPSSGLSSSAALEVGIGLALCAAAEFEIDVLELAKACQRAEHRAVGVPCGILDQAASLLGQPQHAVLLDCSSTDHRYVAVPDDAAFLIIDSGVDRNLEETGYSARRRELESGLTTLGTDNPRDLSLSDIASLEDIPRRRLRHVITENERVIRFAAALQDNDLLRAGRLMSQSHASLRDDYDVSIPELNNVATLAEAAGAFGARLLGGGFGGSVLALSKASDAEELAMTISEGTNARRPTLVVHASAGAEIRSSTT